MCSQIRFTGVVFVSLVSPYDFYNGQRTCSRSRYRSCRYRDIYDSSVHDFTVWLLRKDLFYLFSFFWSHFFALVVLLRVKIEDYYRSCDLRDYAVESVLDLQKLGMDRDILVVFALHLHRYLILWWYMWLNRLFQLRVVFYDLAIRLVFFLESFFLVDHEVLGSMDWAFLFVCCYLFIHVLVL